MFVFTNRSSQSISAISRQFAPFIEKETMLPCFVVSFCNYDLTETTPEMTKLVDISGFDFCSTGTGFLIEKAAANDGIYTCFSADDSYGSAQVFCPNGAAPLPPTSVSDLLLNVYKYRAAACGATMIHSAAVVYDGCGILFCGMPGAGKSTQAHLWEEYLGARTINYDQPCVVKKSGAYRVSGSPWSGKENLYLNTSAPLKAIVFVEQAEVNKAEKQTPAAGFSLIYLNNYLYPLTKKIESAHLENINALVENIPVYRLKCTISREAVEAVYNEVFGKNFDEALRRDKMKYKTKNCFELKAVAGDTLIIPRGAESIDFSAVIILNETGTFIWKQLNEFTDKPTLVQKLIGEYHVGIEIVAPDVDKYIDKMLENGLLDTQE